MTASNQAPLRDLKEGLSSARKADTTHVRQGFKRYTGRPCELGSDKYERANYLRPVRPPGPDPTAADFERFRKYLRAASDHIGEVLDSMERHQAGDPNLLDVAGMKRAAYAVDTDVTPGGKVGASLLPHVAPACSSLMMAIEQAILYGLLPPDPGTPWRLTAAEKLERFGYVEPAPAIGEDPRDVIAPRHATGCARGRWLQTNAGEPRAGRGPGPDCTCGADKRREG